MVVCLVSGEDPVTLEIMASVKQQLFEKTSSRPGEDHLHYCAEPEVERHWPAALNLHGLFMTFARKIGHLNF